MSNSFTGGGLRIENLELALVKDEQQMESQTLSLPHRHFCIEIFACFEGRMGLHTPQSEYVLEAGDVALVPPMQTHCAMLTQETARWKARRMNCVQAEVKDGLDLYTEVASLWLDRPVAVFHRLPTEQLNRLELILSDRVGDRRQVLLLAECLLYLREQQAALPVTTETVDTKRLTELERWINNRYTENITLRDAAQLLFVSERQISRIIRKYYGTTLRQVITDNRLAMAEHLLRTTDMSLLQISVTVGFGAVNTFKTAFQHKYGTDPRSYREAL